MQVDQLAGSRVIALVHLTSRDLWRRSEVAIRCYDSEDENDSEAKDIYNEQEVSEETGPMQAAAVLPFSCR